MSESKSNQQHDDQSQETFGGKTFTLWRYLRVGSLDFEVWSHAESSEYVMRVFNGLTGEAMRETWYAKIDDAITELDELYAIATSDEIVA